MNELVQKLKIDFPDITFNQGDHFKWSPTTKTITYTNARATDTWSLLHELGHAVRNHQSYISDMQLLKKEAEAWEEAVSISSRYAIVIDYDYTQDCMDSYRDWIFRRSICPSCRTQGLQKAPDTYICLNCKSTWLVTKERLCRPYRRLEQ